MGRTVQSSAWVRILDRWEREIDVPDVIIESGGIDASINTAVKAAGRLAVRGEIDLLQARFQPWREVDGISWPLGVFVPTTPQSRWSGTGRARDVDVMDKLVLLQRARVADAFSLPPGANVLTAIRDLIESTGETGVAVDGPTGATLRTAIVWEPGETILRIVNDLCDAINAFSIWCDGWGRFQVTPYTEPGARPIIAEFVHGENATFLAEWTETRNLSSIPNHTIALTDGDDETPGLVAEAWNDDPDDPLSTVHRGVVSAEPETIEATSQSVLDAYAQRRLLEQSTATRTVEIQHVPADLPLNAAVRFEHGPAGIAGRFVVQKTTMPVENTGLQVSTLRQVGIGG